MTNQIIKLTGDASPNKIEQIAVIGGGLAGLTAAVFLARDGRNVTIIEKASEFGGRARSILQDGFYFNQGAHALYMDGFGSKILEELNIKYSGRKVDYTKYFITNKGKKYQSPVKITQLLTTQLLNGLSSKIETTKFFIKLNKMNFEGLERISFQDWLDKTFKNPDSKSFVKMLGRIATYTFNAENLSAKLALDQIKKAVAGGVIYIDEGWQTLVNQLVDIAKRNGVKFVNGKNVLSVEQNPEINRQNNPPLWKLRLNDNTSFSFQGVIIATNPYNVYSLLNKNTMVSPEFLKQLEFMNRPAKVATLDVALNSLPNPDVDGAYGMDTPLYLSLHSAFAKLSTDGNGILFHAMKYLDSSVEPDAVRDKLELEELLDTVQSGWRKKVVRQRFLPNMIASNTVLNSSNKGIMEKRPDIKVPGVNNLYIIGDWVGPEGLLADASFASAKAVALRILNEKEEIKVNPT